MSRKYVTILTDADPHLRNKSEPVAIPLSVKNKKNLKDLLKYITDSHDENLQEKYQLLPASGLAAPQIGINLDMIAVFVDEVKGDTVIEHRLALANPKIISHSEQMAYISSGEGCLSVKKDYEGYVPRYARITVKAYDMLADKEITLRAKGYLSIVLQHEIDHLSGILFYDRINKDNPFHEIPDAIVLE